MKAQMFRAAIQSSISRRVIAAVAFLFCVLGVAAPSLARGRHVPESARAGYVATITIAVTPDGRVQDAVLSGAGNPAVDLGVLGQIRDMRFDLARPKKPTQVAASRTAGCGVAPAARQVTALHSTAHDRVRPALVNIRTGKR